MGTFRVAIASWVAVVLVCVSCNKEAVTPVAPAFVPTEPVPEAVDLGLPSGTLWASFNLGASSRGEKGKSYAWGETEPKSRPTWENYRFWLQGTTTDDVVLSKYVSGEGHGEPDGRTMLGLEDDAAFVHLGSYWRMPDRTQFGELFANCTVKAETVDGMEGVLLTSKVEGFKTQSIFIYCHDKFNESLCFNLMLSELKDDCLAYFSWASSKDTSPRFSGIPRFNPRPIRPVFYVPLEGLFLEDPVSVELGRTQSLSVEKLPANASCRAFTWTSSDAAIATVDNDGKVTGVSIGTATITVSTANGPKLSASCEVNVVSEL